VLGKPSVKDTAMHFSEKLCPRRAGALPESHREAKVDLGTLPCLEEGKLGNVSRWEQ